MQFLAEYDMQIAIDKSVWMYTRGDTEIEWIPVGKNKIQRVNFFAYQGS